jgi:hypothetical protein
MTSFDTTTRALIGAALFALASVPSFAATANDCFELGDPRCPIEAAKADWRSLSHGIRVAPGQPIVTGDGRRLAGSEINYARVLIDRAGEACKQSQHAEALTSVQGAQTLLHPAPRRMR